jgi:hypothetical protein
MGEHRKVPEWRRHWSRLSKWQKGWVAAVTGLTVGISAPLAYINESYSAPVPVYADMHPGLQEDYKGYEPNDMGAQMAELGAQILSFANATGYFPGRSVQRYLGGSAVLLNIQCG